METLATDLRGAIRHWLRSPSLAIITVVVTAVGTVGTLAIFSLIDALTFRHLPVKRPGQLVAISARHPDPAVQAGLPVNVVTTLATSQTTFIGLAGAGGAIVSVSGPDGRRDANVDGVTLAYFDVLGISPGAGRFFTEEDVATSAHVAVVSYDYWERQLGRSPNAVGENIDVHGVRLTIVGITRKGFGGLGFGWPTDLTVPIGLLPGVAGASRDPVPVVFIVGRLSDGAKLANARSEIEGLWSAALRDSVPTSLTPSEREEFFALRPMVVSAATGVSVYYDYRQAYARPLLWLFFASGLVLLLVGANVSTLFLARSAAREREFGIRSALGATPWRLVRQVMGECALLAVVGTSLSIPVALWAARAISGIVQVQPEVRSFDFAPEFVVFLGVACALGAALMFGLLPAYHATRSRLVIASRSTPSTAGKTRRWGRRLVIGQIAIIVPLLVAAWIVTDNLRRLLVSPGFELQGVSLAALDAQPGGYSNLDPSAYLRRLVDDLSGTPGIEAVSLTDRMPLAPNAGLGPESQLSIAEAGTPVDAGHAATVVAVTPGFFAAAGIGVNLGRDLAWGDDGKQPRVALLSADLARRLFGTHNAVGRRIQIGARTDVEVVGVVQDLRLTNVHQQSPLFVFTPLLQNAPRAMRSPFIVFRSSVPPLSVSAEIRRRVEALGQDEVWLQRTLSDQLNQSVTRERLVAISAGYFGGLSVVIFVLGLAGVLSYAVSRRTRELGLRASLGASPSALRTLIIGEAMTTASIGLLIGLPAALMFTFLLTRAMPSMQVSVREPVAFIGASVITALVAFAAAWLPGRRASRTSPADAMRAD